MSNWAGGGGIHCGNGAHKVAGLVHCAWSVVPDFKYCKYAIYFGASKGHGAGDSVAIAACSGHWAKGMPIAKGKGTNFDALLQIDSKHMDPLVLNIETCVRAKVYKAEEG